jgi:phospholipid/cholesterol/gamma-HCH transport system substrate-binding protein
MRLETKVGAFFVASIFVVGWLIFKTEKITVFDKTPKRVFSAEFSHAAGLPKQGKVRIAGGEGGKVIEIRRAGNTAVVSFSVHESVPVYANAVASLANIGILGEKYIDLNPGHSDRGALETGARLASVTALGMDTIMEGIGAIAADLRGITFALNESIGGEGGRMKLDEIMDNLRTLTAEFRAVAQENHGALNRTMANIEGLSGDLRERLPVLAKQFGDIAGSLDALLNQGGPEITGLAKDVRKLAAGFQTASENLGAITDRINKGEGTIGKLLTDETTVAKLNEAVGGINDLLSGLGGMEVRLDMNAASWMGRGGQGGQGGQGNWGSGRAGLDVELARRNDYWYSVGLYSTPDGRVRDETTVVTWTDPATGEQVFVPANYRVVSAEQAFNFSAEFNKRIGKNIVVHAGIIEGTGGGGVQYRAFKDRFRLSALAYDFKQRDDKENPRLRASASLEFWRGLYAEAGMQDLANKDTRSFFVGGGFRWKDDDIKKLVGLAGVAK